MCGASRPDRAGWVTYTYNVCPWRLGNPRDLRRCPEHVTASLREDVITAAISGLLDQYALGYDGTLWSDGTCRAPRSTLPPAMMRRSPTSPAGSRGTRPRVQGLMIELAQLGDDTSPASTAYRTRIRIRERFTQLFDEIATLKAQLAALAA